MNYYMTAHHYRSNDYPSKNILECSLSFNRIDTVSRDTTHFLFSFYYGTPKDVYVPEPFYFSGIGYSKVGKNYFPVLSTSNQKFINDEAASKLVFQERENSFLKYLMDYTEEMSLWLKNEAKKRKAS